MKNILLLYILTTLNIFSQNVSDELLFENHCEAATNYLSTYQLYTVAFIDDGKSDEPKEICMTGNELLFALRNEWNLDVEDFDGLINRVKAVEDRKYTIISEESLVWIYRIQYSKKDLKEFHDKVKFDSLVVNIQGTESWSYFGNSEKEQVMMAHLLFNSGIQTGINECYGGEQLEIFTGY